MLSHTHPLSKLTPERAALRREGWRHPSQSICPSSGPETTQPTQTAASSHSPTTGLQQFIGWVFWSLITQGSCMMLCYILHIVENSGLGETRNFSSLHSVCIMREQPSDTGGWEDQEINIYFWLGRESQ